MNISQEEKKAIFEKYGQNIEDTGSPAAQVALFTERIHRLTEHLKLHKKDHSTRRGLLLMVGKRRRLLNYIMKKDIEAYRDLIKRLGIRK
ncbi:MAG: 30S ribosomal protein S15 [Cyclonatronaceae bacterium]